MTEDEMVGWHHRLDGHEFEQALEDGETDGEAWCAIVHEVEKSWTQLSNELKSFGTSEERKAIDMEMEKQTFSR